MGDSCDSCGRKKCPDERHAECPAIGAECRACGRKGHFHRCCKNPPKLPVPMQPFPHFDPNDPRVQLQRTLDRLEEERTRKQMEAGTWQLAMEEERARKVNLRRRSTCCPRFSCKNCEGVCLCRIVRSFLRGSKLLSPWHLETCPTKATKQNN